MKVKGEFICFLFNRNTDHFHPEGEWKITARDGEAVAENSIAIEDLQSQPLPKWRVISWVTLKFKSASGKTGGTLEGHYEPARGVFYGRGEIWGAAHTGWQPGSLFAPSTANVRLAAVSPQTYIGSLPGMAGKPVQQAKRLYEGESPS